MPSARSIVSNLAGPAVVFAVGAVMAVWTWGTWPDVLVDYGKELYIAWRLSAGEPLYSGVAYYMGPLSPTVNGLLFSIFGVGFRTLVIANLCVAAGVAGLLMYLANVAAGRAAAIVAGLLFVLLFAFTQFTVTGNYNFICPYEHEYTHGMLISLATLTSLWRGLATRRAIWFCYAGVGCGLVALTRAELFIAIASAVGLGLVLGRVRFKSWAVFMSGGGVVVFAALALLCVHLPVRDAVVGVLGSWPSTFNTKLTSLPFYRHGMGLLDPALSVRLLLIGTSAWIGWLLPAGLTAWAVQAGRQPMKVRLIVTATFGIYVLLTAMVWKTVAATTFFRPLTMSVIACCVVAVRAWWKAPLPLSTFRVVLAAFAGFLLLKMILYARIHQYGFAVAMPAALVTAVTVGVLLPRWIDSKGGSGAVLRAAMLAVGLVVAGTYLSITGNWIAGKTVQVGNGVDRFWADAVHGSKVNQCVADLKQLPPSITALVMPEGAMINYLSRRAEPTPYANFNPPDLAIFGEAKIANAIQTHPADRVIIVHKDTSEFGVRFFGYDYGQPIFAWIRANYRVVEVIGKPPLQKPREFGIAELAPDAVKP